MARYFYVYNNSYPLIKNTSGLKHSRKRCLLHLIYFQGVFDDQRTKVEPVSVLNKPPKSPNRSSLFEILSSNRDSARSPTELLAKDMSNKCAVSAEPMKDKASAKESWRKRILYKKREQGQFETFRFDETVEFSFEHENSEMKEMSFESTSSRSPVSKSELSFTCDSSVDAPEYELLSPQPVEETTVLNKKEKETKKQKFKRMITRPLRRSQSACCENEIPSHALFLDSKGNKVRDTVSPYI